MSVPENAGGSVNRYSPAERLIELGLLLAESRGPGLTIDEMADELGVSRRSAERMRNSLHRVTGGALIATTTEDGFKRWRLTTAKFAAFTTPDLDELAQLKLAGRRLRQEGNVQEAGRLERLSLKLEAAMPRTTLRRLQPDIELLLEASGILVRPRPRIEVDPEIIDMLRTAILSSQQVRLTYKQRHGGDISRPRVHPYGFLAGSRDYLVGFNTHPQVREHRLYVLSNIESVEHVKWTYERDSDFDLEKFAARSFGAFWDGRSYEVEWRFKPQVAEDARSFRFHPQQVLTDNPDGSVSVTFTASGLTEMVWHLFTWGDTVEVVRPTALRQRYQECWQAAQAAFLTEV